MDNIFNPSPALPEFVGRTVLDTVGLVIPSIDDALRREMDLPDDVRALGTVSSRTGAAGQICAIDEALKSAAVSLIQYMTPNRGTSHSNEVIIAFTGDASAVKTAVLTAREIGLELITAMGEYPTGPSTPYLS